MKNEGSGVGATVAGFAPALPNATVYVYDNNSRDGTREARRSGRDRQTERQQGKGHVVRRVRRHRCRRLRDGRWRLTYDPKAA